MGYGKDGELRGGRVLDLDDVIVKLESGIIYHQHVQVRTHLAAECCMCSAGTGQDGTPCNRSRYPPYISLALRPLTTPSDVISKSAAISPAEHNPRHSMSSVSNFSSIALASENISPGMGPSV